MIMQRIWAYSISVILLSACGGSNKPVADEIPEKPTFAEHIAPIIHNNCTPCHRDESIAPFKLVTYDDVKRKGGLIKVVTATRYMPPWPADPNYRHFIGEKVLTDTQIKTIERWVDQGMVAGDTTNIPPLKDFDKPYIKQKPDLVIAFDKAYIIKGTNTDNFLVMRLPYQIAKDTFVKYIEFVPGNRKAVHHVNTNLLSYEPEKKRNVFDGQRYFVEDWNTAEEGRSSKMDKVSAIHKAVGIPNDDGTYPMLTYSVSNYLPGAEPYMYPDGIGGYYFKQKGALYLNDMHYGPMSTDAKDSSYFNIYYAPKPPERPTGEFIIGTLSTGGKAPVKPALIVPPNEVKTFTAEMVMPKDISLLTVVPHMHLIGKTFVAYAIPPQGDTIPLIRINNWDFRWQYFYNFKQMVKIPAGSRIVAEGTYDNTARNVNNPYSPPREIREREGSMKTTDEMFQLICVYVDYKPGDENISLEQKD